MPSPTNPKRLQVRDRIVTVLQAITAGASYFYTPGEVLKRAIDLEQVQAYPCYMVVRESGGTIELAGHDLYRETFNLAVLGYVADDDDPSGAAEKAIRDVRKAIMADMDNGASGSLQTLAVNVHFTESPETDNGWLDEVGRGAFAQRVQVIIDADMGE